MLPTILPPQDRRYYSASFSTYLSTLQPAATRYPDRYDAAGINRLIRFTGGKLLCSFADGQIPKKPEGYSARNDYFFRRVREKVIAPLTTRPEFAGMHDVIMDSGGYQIQEGYIRPYTIPEFISRYYLDFLQDNHHHFGHCFTVDVAGGRKYSPDEVSLIRLNRHSMTVAAGLPEDIRAKLMMVYHFRDAELYGVFHPLLEEFGAQFGAFATGGLVGGGKGRYQPPICRYVIPLTDVAAHVKKQGRNQFRFHFLGVSQMVDMLSFRFMERILAEYQGMDAKCTFDSSTIWQESGKSRFGRVLNGHGQLDYVMFRTPHELADLSDVYRYPDVQTLYTQMNELFRMADMQEVTPDTCPIFAPRGGDGPGAGHKDYAMSSIFALNLALLIHYQMALKETWALTGADELFSAYQDDDVMEFGRIYEEYTRKAGDVRRKTPQKAAQLFEGGRVLARLDTEYTAHVVQHYPEV